MRKKLALHELFPYPAWISAAIEYRDNQDFLVNETIINSEREPFAKKSMIPQNYPVNASEIGE